jgi:hypothetical protein
MQRGLQTVDGEVEPLVLNALVSGSATVLGTHRPADGERGEHEREVASIESRLRW